MADDPVDRVRLARDRLIAAGVPDADRVVLQALALALHLGEFRAIATLPDLLGALGDLSHGPGRRDRSLCAAAPPATPALTRLWPAIVDLLAPAAPRDAEALGAAREALLGGARKGSGSYYTRPPLARAVARRTLARWLVDSSSGASSTDPPTTPTSPRDRADNFSTDTPADPANSRDRADNVSTDTPADPTSSRVALAEVPAVCDPAMGCGSLLLAAQALLAARFGLSAATLALHGVDSDPLAVDVSRFLLWRAAGAPAADLGLADRLVCGDSLVGAWTHELDRPVPPDMLRAALDRRAAVASPWPLHWELAFPQVFAAGGFTAVLANPPWDAIKPTTREFALLHGHARDPQDPRVAAAWQAYQARHAALSRWFQRSGQYRHQGRADRNAYKLFCERCLIILRPGGALGLLVPAGIYSDQQTAELRRLLLATCQWTHLYAFQNERFVFPGVDHRTKVAFVGATKDGPTTALRTRFRIGPGDSPTIAEIEADMLDESRYLARPAASLIIGSAVAEIRDARGADVFAAVHARTTPLMNRDAWNVRYAREFDMARDAALFPAVAAWEARGYRPDEYGHWLAGDWRSTADDAIRGRDGASAIALTAITGLAMPLLQGAQIHQHTSAARSWRCGTGLRATWDPVDPHRPWFGPQYLIDHTHARRSLAGTHVRVGYREVARSTDTRTLIAAVLPPFPAGHKVPNLLPGDGSPISALALCAELNSLCSDYAARARLGASSLTAAFLADIPVGAPTLAETLAPWAARLGLTHPRFAPLWLDPRLRALLPTRPWMDLWAVTPHERLRLRCLLDALVAHHRGLTPAAFAELVRGCDHPAAALRQTSFTRTLDPKGFWRVDRDRDPELRLPVLALRAFNDLCARGPDAFVADDGWQLPTTLRLADLGLGHDARARELQPVAARLGSACPEVQVDDRARSWDACARHAARLAQLMAWTC